MHVGTKSLNKLSQVNASLVMISILKMENQVAFCYIKSDIDDKAPLIKLFYYIWNLTFENPFQEQDVSYKGKPMIKNCWMIEINIFTDRKFSFNYNFCQEI